MAVPELPVLAIDVGGTKLAALPVWRDFPLQRLDFTRNVRVVQAELGAAAGLYGAAMLAFRSRES